MRNLLISIDIEHVSSIDDVEAIVAQTLLDNRFRYATHDVDEPTTTGGTCTHQRVPKARPYAPLFMINIVDFHGLQNSARRKEKS